VKTSNAFLFVVILAIGLFFSPAAHAADTTLVPTGSVWIKVLRGARHLSTIQPGGPDRRNSATATVMKQRQSALGPTPTTNSSPPTFVALLTSRILPFSRI
jgi:hypothetical protein